MSAGTVLIVDDDPLILGALQAILVRAGYGVRTATDGDAALASLDASPCDLVLLDILMPRKEGLETLIELKRRTPDVVVIAMSASVVRKQNDFLTIAAKFGADAILRKPFTPEDLSRAIAAAQTRRRQLAGAVRG
jgi:DNA-binding response OmpR family regulator